MADFRFQINEDISLPVIIGYSATSKKISARLAGRVVKVTLPNSIRKKIPNVYHNKIKTLEVNIVKEFLEKNKRFFLQEIQSNPFHVHPDLKVGTALKILFLGAVYEIKWDSGYLANVVKFNEEEKVILVCHRKDLTIPEAQSVLTKFFKKNLNERLQKFFKKWKPSFPNVNWNKLKIEVINKSSSWGSLSGNNTVSMSFSLSFVGDAELEYVVVHELCHTLHFDHSPAFWREVKTRLPYYLKNEKILKQIGSHIAIQISLLKDCFNENYK